MLAAIATERSFPCLAFIASTTCSHESRLRLDITTLAPASAYASAIARPIPRDDPVMIATFPLRSNKSSVFPLFMLQHQPCALQPMPSEPKERVFRLPGRLQ